MISVLITAFEREDYVLSAVRSALPPGRPDPEIEVVVLRSFHNSELDRELEQAGARLVDFGSPHLGLTLLRGIRECRGEVVCFLEDDDRFRPEKLAVVRSAFASRPDLNLLWNDREEVDPTGAPLPRARPPFGRLIGPDEGTTVEYPSDVSLCALGRATLVLPGAFLSCMAVRRSMLEEAASDLAQLPIATDFYVFFRALATPGRTILDPRPLTVLLRHVDSYSARLIHDAALFQRFSAGSQSYEQVLRELARRSGLPELHRLVETDLAYHRLFLALIDPAKDRRALHRALGDTLRWGSVVGKPGGRRTWMRALWRWLGPGA